MRYVTCNRCSLTYGRQNFKIPVVAHNANRYDIHHIVLGLKDMSDVGVLAKNSEKFICLKWGKHLVFIDSIYFLAGSLDNLSRTLPDSEVTPYLNYISTDAGSQKLLRLKGIFPYDFLDSPDKLMDTALSAKDAFHDSLTNKPINESEYHRAQQTWEIFNCRNLKEYLGLYLCLDTLLLATVVESYRKSTDKHFQLDPLHYVSAPSSCFDAMLKITGVTLDTLPSVDMYLFFTKAIQGGITGASTRYARANNRYCDWYDHTEPVSHLITVDSNNLYGHSLCQHLPTNDFQWITASDLETFDVNCIPEHGDRGYVLEVEYPKHLYDSHDDFPRPRKRLMFLVVSGLRIQGY